jgi:ornithine cyclodeaminase/alanine dehydrogenase
MSNVLLLTAADITGLLDPGDCLGAVEEAFRRHGEGTVAPPVVCGLHVAGGGFHVKAGLLDAVGSRFVAKANANFPGNPARGVPTIQGLALLFDGVEGRPLAIMDSARLTVLRTAAATAVAAKYLARRGSEVLTICGCGEQGRAHIEALAQVLPLRRVHLVDRDRSVAERLVRDATRLGLDARVGADLAACARESDVCVTCTPSREWLLDAADVRPGTFVAGVGADSEEKQELSPALLRRGRVFVDVIEQCCTMGDLHHALREGCMGLDDVCAELGQVVAGLRPGRQTDEEVTIFDSTGMALQDVASAVVVYERARASGRGVPFAFSEMALNG